MKTTRFQKITAFVLAVLFIMGGSSVAVSAAGNGGNNEENSLANIRELLNAISYNEYVQTEEYKGAPIATSPIPILGTNGKYVDEAGDVVSPVGNVYSYTGNDATDQAANAAFNKSKPGIFNDYTTGKNGLFIPESGSVTWTIPNTQIATAAKYNMYIEYYPIDNKSADVEKTLLINGKVPFAEARYLTMSKYWTTPYPSAKHELTKKMDPNAVLAEAIAAGFTDAALLAENGKNYLTCSYPASWTSANTAFVEKYALRFFTADIDANEIRESLSTTPKWSTYTFKDSNGFVQTPFAVLIGPDKETGVVELTFESVNEPVVISKIDLVPAATYTSYDAYRAQYAGVGAGQGSIKIEAEYFTGVSDQTVYPLADTTSAANSPIATDKTYLNTIGGEKWQNVGQWIEYKFTVSQDGMYSLAARYKQNILDGMSTSRVLYLYSDSQVAPGTWGYYNGVPFDEATRLKFNYDDSWQAGYLTDGVKGANGKDRTFEFFFKAGVVYTMRLEVSLGAMGNVVSRVQEALDAINSDYLDILKVTGTSPDESKDYRFYETLPKTMGDMYEQYEEIYKNEDSIINEINNGQKGKKSSMTATLENVALLLEEMSTDQDQVAKNLSQLKTYIGSLGTWLGDAKTQPLTLDYILVQNATVEVPKANAGFWASLWHEISGFWQSFFRNYDRMGATTDYSQAGIEDEPVEVWLAYGRDQAQVIRNLINNNFKATALDANGNPKQVTVNLKLVAGGTLLPSILAGKGPDVYLGLGAGEVINYAIRGALAPIDQMNGFDEIRSNFNEEAMMVLEIECAGSTITRKDGTIKNNQGHEACTTPRTWDDPHCYGLPETQGFPMMFVREDILAELNIEIPQTWDDVKETIPVLQANNMEIAMSSDSNIFIYQMGGELFADDGMRINLDSNVALTAFEEMCEMFTMYSFPYQYDFANRFRTGEMPIGFADYTGTYNQLKVFATEIEGLWSFYPLPGMVDENGNINNDSVSGVSAVVLIAYDTTDAVEQAQANAAWEFMKWYVGAECQVSYSNEMVAILGPSAKHATANKVALESLPWTRAEYEQIYKQFNNLAAIPNYPGAYIIGRYTKFAFLDAFNDNLNPVESLLGYISYINEEITRKRGEFGLEALEISDALAKKRSDLGLKKLDEPKTLAIKRMQEVETLLYEYKAIYPAYTDVIDPVLREIKDFETEDYAALYEHAKVLRARDPQLFGAAADKLDQAAKRLQEYERYNDVD